MFKWVGGEKSVFKMTPDKGSVPSNSFIDCILTYTPSPVLGEIKI